MPYGGSLLLPFQPFSEPTFGSTGPLSVDERFSTLLKQYLPDFVSDDNPVFVSFVKAYLEYTEIHGNTRAEAVRISTYSDVDKTLSNFLKFFKSTYLYRFPDELHVDVDEKNLIKNIKDYYGEKGNPRSLDLLFRVLYNKGVDVDFPRDQIFTIGDSDYTNSVSILTTRTRGASLMDFIGGQVIQRETLDDLNSPLTATAFVDDIIFKLDDSTKTDYADIILKERVGQFRSSLPVEFSKSGVRNRRENVFNLLKELKPRLVGGVTQDGSKYSIGESVLVRDAKNKIVAKLVIDDVSALGEIQSVSKPLGKPVRIFTTETDYTVTIQSPSGTGASLEIFGGRGEVLEEVLFSTDKSTLSGSSRIQNNFNYQEYAYKIRAEKSLSDYAGIVKKVFHPAGSMMLAEYVFNEGLSLEGFTSSESISPAGERAFRGISPRIGNYLAYAFSTTGDLRGDSVNPGGSLKVGTYVDYYPSGFGGITPASFGTTSGTGAAEAVDLKLPFTNQNAPLGNGVYGGDEEVSPELLLNNFRESDRVFGYEPAPAFQPRMRATDSTTFGTDPNGGYIVFRHPRNLMAVGRSTDAQLDKVRSGFEFDSIGRVSRRERRMLVTSASSSVSDLAVGDTVTQTIPNATTAVGEVIAITTVPFDQSPCGGLDAPSGHGASNTANTLVKGSKLPSFSDVAGSLAGSNVNVITIDVINGLFTSQVDIKGNPIPANFENASGTTSGTFDVLGASAGAPIPNAPTGNDISTVAFEDIRLDDFFSQLKVPVPD